MRGLRSRSALVVSAAVVGVLLLGALFGGGLWWARRAAGSAGCTMPATASKTPWSAPSSCSVVTLVRTSGRPTVSVASGTTIRLDFTLHKGERTFGAGEREPGGVYRVVQPQTYYFGINHPVCHDGAGTPSDCRSWIDYEADYSVEVQVRGALVFEGSPQFVSPTVGWALGGGAIGTQGATDTTVWRSGDGGRTWSNVTPAAFYSQTPPAFSDPELHAVDGKFAFIIDAGTARYYRTTDGGAQWTALPLPSGWDPGTDIGWPPGDLASIGGGNLYTLPPGSNTWVAHPLPPSIADAGAGVELSGSGSRLIAMTSLPDPVIAVSADGGSTWHLAPAPPALGVAGTCPDFPPFFQVFDQLDASLVGGCGTLQLWTTTDGGLHWTASPSGVADAEWGGGTAVQAGEQVPPDFLDVKHGWVWQWAGQNVRLVSTADGGQHWTPLPRLFPPMSTVHFVTPSTGFVWTGSSTFETTDGGHTWAQLPAPRRTH